MTEKILVETDLTAVAYAAEQGLSTRQVIKRITNGELFGYQNRGVWYVRIKTVLQLKEPPSETFPDMKIPLVPLPVAEYSRRTGIPIAKILEDIARGTKPGFHAQGIWYIGTPPRSQQIKRQRFYMMLQLLSVAVFVLLLLGTGFLWWTSNRDKPKLDLASLSVEIKINDRMGMPHPVVGEAFFLLAKDLEDIAIDYIKDIGTSKYAAKPKSTNTNSKWIAMLPGSTALRSLLFDVSSRFNRVSVWEFRQNFEQSKALWFAHAMRSAVTNKSGQIEFKSLPLQEYWVMGWTETSSGFVFWRYWILPQAGENKLLLHPGNAVYFR